LLPVVRPLALQLVLEPFLELDLELVPEFALALSLELILELALALSLELALALEPLPKGPQSCPNSRFRLFSTA
jgi:hypothetical protein